MPILIRPDGTEIEVNENSLAHAKLLGWVEKEKEKPKRKPRKTKKSAE
jgi:hypothetical protein